MVGNWKQETCAIQPDEIQIIADGIYMQRKNIREVVREAIEGQEGYTSWECDSREISVTDYNILKELENVQVDDAIDAYTMQLIEEGVL